MTQKRIRDSRRNVIEAVAYVPQYGEWSYQDWLIVFLKDQEWHDRIKTRDKIWLFVEEAYPGDEKTFKKNFDDHVRKLAKAGVIERRCIEDKNELRWTGKECDGRL